MQLNLHAARLYMCVYWASCYPSAVRPAVLQLLTSTSCVQGEHKSNSLRRLLTFPQCSIHCQTTACTNSERAQTLSWQAVIAVMCVDAARIADTPQWRRLVFINVWKDWLSPFSRRINVVSVKLLWCSADCSTLLHCWTSMFDWCLYTWQVDTSSWCQPSITEDICHWYTESM